MYGSNETALNAKNLVEGYCWFTTDDGKFYVDTKNSSGVLSRILLNAGKADQLATARTIRTNLGSTATASFNGTANITPGVTGILPITNGGTGADNVDSARHNLTNLGSDVITSTANDTVAKWGAYKGLGFSMYTKTGQLNDQPSQYGLLLNIGHSTSEVHQLWLTQSHGNIYHRGGNSSGWGTQSWVTLLDSHNYNTYVPKKDGTGASGTWGISVSGNAATATKLATARTISLTGAVTGSGSFDGSGNLSIATTAAGYLQQIAKWNCTITCATWSRLCYIPAESGVIGTKFLLFIGATRNSVVYNDLFVITTHHSSSGNIVKIGGNSYSSGYQLRILSNSNGDCYVELYDALQSAISSTTQTVFCRLIPIFAGAGTYYTNFTSGTSIPSGFTVKQTMAMTNNHVQADSIQGAVWN